jgi:hypothetical protein
LQVPQAPESSWHWKLEPLSLELNWKLPEVDVVVPVGPDAIVVCGAVVSGGGLDSVGGVGWVGVIGSSLTGGAGGAEVTGGVTGGAGGPAGTLWRLRGFVRARTSAPSPKPSPSVSNLRGLVLVLCSSVQVLSPSRSASLRRPEAVFTRFTTCADLTSFCGPRAAAGRADETTIRATNPSRNPG